MISKKILDNIFSGICVLSTDLTVVVWNHLMEVFTGIPERDIINKNINTFFKGFNEESVSLRLEMVITAGVPIVFSSQLHRNLFKTEEKDNKNLFLETTATPFELSDGQKTILLTIKDVSELNVQIIKYRKMRDRALEEVERRKIIEEKLVKINSNLEEMANTDTLTNLYNRRYITERLEEELSRNQRHGGEFSVIISDIDFFKKINDSYGHDCGDYVLKEMSRLLKKSIRNIDTVARWGGEEFLLLLPETNMDQAAMLAEKLREKIAKNIFSFSGKTFNITMTFGLSLSNLSDNSMDAIIKRADIALYKGKHEGRNCIVKEY